MGRPKSSSPYSICRMVRFREEDWQMVRSAMEAEGYRSFGIFARNRIMGGRQVRIQASKSEQEAIDRLASEFRRIGTNYNQVARQINTYMTMRDPRGMLIPRHIALSDPMDKLCAMTQKLDRMISELRADLIIKSEEGEQCNG